MGALAATFKEVHRKQKIQKLYERIEKNRRQRVALREDSIKCHEEIAKLSES